MLLDVVKKNLLFCFLKSLYVGHLKLGWRKWYLGEGRYLQQCAGVDGTGEGKQRWTCPGSSSCSAVALRLLLLPSIQLTFSSTLEFRFYRGSKPSGPSTLVSQL